ncbi:MAG: hypothetical protein WCO42_08550 [bacterium]
MKPIKLLGILFGLSVAAGSYQVFGDETTGKVSDTGYYSFKLDEQGTIRQFNASVKKTKYEPETWRPEVGDEIKVVYGITKGRGGASVLEVETTTLVKAGPNNIGDVKSPVTATIVETGASGVKVKLPKGQIVKFEYSRSKTEKVPVGWVETAGDKAIITFHAQPNRFTGKVSLAADKVEKTK